MKIEFGVLFLFLFLAISASALPICTTPQFVHNVNPSDKNTLELYPDISGRYLIWQEFDIADMTYENNGWLYLYDLGLDNTIGTIDDKNWVISNHSKGQTAKISGNRIVFQTDSGALMACLIQAGGCIPDGNGQTFQIISTSSIKKLDFKGDLLVFSQDNNGSLEIVLHDFKSNLHKIVPIYSPYQQVEVIVRSSGTLAAWTQYEYNFSDKNESSKLIQFNPLTMGKKSIMEDSGKGKLEIWDAASYDGNNTIILAGTGTRFNIFSSNHATDRVQFISDQNASKGATLNKSVFLGFSPFERKPSENSLFSPHGIVGYDFNNHQLFNAVSALPNTTVHSFPKSDGKNIVYSYSLINFFPPSSLTRVKMVSCQ
ncbi:MAG: hypothetical protein HY393_00285 [Candidatus Diapherotrites archaeon]|nr:hypothetical protein [Candidatus Diapherotrites archaeon]